MTTPEEILQALDNGGHVVARWRQLGAFSTADGVVTAIRQDDDGHWWVRIDHWESRWYRWDDPSFGITIAESAQ